MIKIKNTQRSIPLDIEYIKRIVSQILSILKYEDFDIGIWFTNNKTIRFFNKKYRRRDTATDIVSFPFYPELKYGERIKVHMPDEKNLGDMIISAPYVARAAQTLQVPFKQHLTMLLVHGICHLLGYDHVKDTDYRIMRRKENDILRKLALMQ